MLYFPQTRPEVSVERPVALGSLIASEGAALIDSLSGGQYGVKPSTGVAGEVFVGVSLNSVSTMTQAPAIDEATIGNTLAVTLTHLPLPGSVRVVKTATGAVLAAAAAASATEYAVDANNPQRFIFDASLQGAGVTVTYSFAPTVAQAVAMQGNILPGGPAGQYLGQVGVITRGDVFTDMWDTAADWSTAVGVVLQASGRFGPTAVAANALRGVRIIELPTAGRAALGLNINAAV